MNRSLGKLLFISPTGRLSGKVSDEEMLKARQEHQKFHPLEANEILAEKLQLIQSMAKEEAKDKSKLNKTIESIESMKQSSGSDVDLPPETYVTKQRDDEASMLRSIASSVYTNRTANFNAEFKRSIHKVGLARIVGKNLYLIYGVYLIGLIVGLIYILVRAGMLSNIPLKIREQHYMTEQASEALFYHRLLQIASIMRPSNLAEGYEAGAQAGLFNKDNNIARWNSAMQNYRDLVKVDSQYLWSNHLNYFKNEGLETDLTLGEYYLQELIHFSELIITKSSSGSDQWRALNMIHLANENYEVFEVLKDEIQAGLDAQVYLFIGAIIIMILVAVVLVWVFILISREINEFFSRCSVIFERLDSGLLESEMENLECALNMEDLIFEKICSFTTLRTDKRLTKKSTKTQKLGLAFEPTFAKEEVKEEAKDEAQKNKSKKDEAVRIVIPSTRRSMNKQKQEANKLRRRGMGIKEKKTIIGIIVVMILVCLNFPIVVDWLSNYSLRSDIAAWLQIDQALQEVLQFGTLDSNMLLLKLDPKLTINAEVQQKIALLEGMGKTQGYQQLFDHNQLITKYLDASFLNANLCTWPDLLANRVEVCLKFSKGIKQFGILNAVSSVQQFTQEANSLIEGGKTVSLESNGLLASTFQMNEIIEQKIKSGLNTSFGEFSSLLDSYLLGKSILFCSILVGSLLLIVGLHYNRWLAPTSLFWRRVARTLSILPKNILLQSNFFMKAHFERLIKLRV